MRVLIVTGNFAGENQSPWLLDDLAVAFAAEGDVVDVIVYDTKHARTRGSDQRSERGIRLTSVGPSRIRTGRLGKLRNYLNTGWGLHTLGYRTARSTKYDLCVYTSIGAFSWGLPARLRNAKIVRCSAFVMWDFFPIHQLEIGRIKMHWAHWPLRALESLSIRNADVVAVMSPANERFFHSYHPEARGRTIIVPPWASGAIDSAKEGHLKRARFTVIFGGQLVLGRGIDTLLHAARILQDTSREVEILIVGDGPARDGLVDLANDIGLTNTSFVNGLRREDYRELLRTAHVGVAVTVAGVTPPTFPSKIVEYCASGIPMVVCVEAASDAGTIVEAAGVGLSARAGDSRSLATAISVLYDEEVAGTLAARGRRAREFFEAELSATRAADALRSAAVHM